MDNKILLDLVAKNLDAIKLLVEALQNEEKVDPILIEITAEKAKAVYQELILLSQVQTETIEIDEVDFQEETSIEERDIQPFAPTGTIVENEVSPSSEVENNMIEKQETIHVETQTELNTPHQIEETVTNKEFEFEAIPSAQPTTEEKLEEPESEIQEVKILSKQSISESSVNDKLAATVVHESKVKGLPVTNLMNAIGINDRFLYIRELFANESANFEKTVEHLDGLNSFLEAIDFLEKNFRWTKNEASLKFMELLKRRFEK